MIRHSKCVIYNYVDMFINITMSIELAIQNCLPIDRTEAQKIFLIVTFGRFFNIDYINTTIVNVLKRYLTLRLTF